MGNFTKDTIITFLTRLITAVITIVVTIIIARTLGPKGQGIYSVAILFPSLLLVFTSFGLSSASVFFLGKKKYSSQEIFGTGIIFNVLISILTILIGLGVVFFFAAKFFPGIEKRYLFLSLFLIPLLLFFNLGCQILLGLQKIKKYNIISFFQSGLFLILIGILLFGMHFGITVTILAQITSYVIALIILLLIASKETNGINFKPNENYFKESFLYGFKVHLAGIFDFLHSRIDLFLLNIFINPFAVGIYYTAVKLTEGIWLLAISTGTVLFPKLASEKDEKSVKDFTPLVCRNILLLTTLMVILLFFLSNRLILFFYSANFVESIRPFQILLIGAIAISGWNILCNDLAARGRPMLNTYAIGISVLFNIFLSIILIPKWGIIGAAWATTASYITMFLVTLFIYQKISHNKVREIIFIKMSDLFLYKKFFINIKKNRI